jgi:hypothetical protein
MHFNPMQSMNLKRIAQLLLLWLFCQQANALASEWSHLLLNGSAAVPISCHEHEVDTSSHDDGNMKTTEQATEKTSHCGKSTNCHCCHGNCQQSLITDEISLSVAPKPVFEFNSLQLYAPQNSIASRFRPPILA